MHPSESRLEALLARLDEATDEGEREELVRGLCADADPTIVATLRARLLDPTEGSIRRATASLILRECDFEHDEPAAVLLGWWGGDDALLRLHALRSMGRSCPDVVLEVARDPRHVHHEEAIGRMQFFFGAPEHQRIKIAALSHPAPSVRATAAYVLLWDEPACAEEPLLRATIDTVSAVVVEACRTLEYYPTHRVIRRLSELRRHDDVAVRRQAHASLEAVGARCADALEHPDAKQCDHVRRWLSPVSSLLPPAFDDSEAPSSGSPMDRVATKPLFVPHDRLRVAIEGGSYRRFERDDLLRRADWHGLGGRERGELIDLMLASRDPSLRARGADVLHRFGETDRLAALLNDPSFVVRKEATYWLGQAVPTRPDVAEVLWERLQRDGHLGVHGPETLDSFVRHASARTAVPRLVSIAERQDAAESLRVTAVEGLQRCAARSELERLMPRLREAPSVTWAFHIALLEAAAPTGIPTPPIDDLREVDHLDVQLAIAAYV